MLHTPYTPVRVAVLDLYDNEPNQGMRCIQEMLAAADGAFYDVPVSFDVFEARYKDEFPGLDFDVFISTGGPGSPLDTEGEPWDTHYLAWLDALWNHNQRQPGNRRHGLFICHSFQMMVRHFRPASIAARKSPSFGVFPVHMTEAGREDRLFRELGDPFFAADFRSFQVVEPDRQRMRALGAEVLALEKERPYVPYERAVMGIRLTPELVGVQFHPEADPEGMSLHFRDEKRRATIVEKHGEEKYDRILHRLEDPAYLKQTHDAVMPSFLHDAVAALRPEAVEKAARKVQAA